MLDIGVCQKAATIRVVSSARGLPYEYLAPVTAGTNISLLERGKIGITVDKLIELPTPLKLDPMALLAVSISPSNGETPEAALKRARVELDRFRSGGGLDLLAKQIVDDTLVQRSEGSRKAPEILRLLGSSRRRM